MLFGKTPIKNELLVALLPGTQNSIIQPFLEALGIRTFSFYQFTFPDGLFYPNKFNGIGKSLLGIKRYEWYADVEYNLWSMFIPIRGDKIYTNL